MLFITPRVVENEVDITRVIDDLRRRMENLDRLFPYITPFPAEVFPDGRRVRRRCPPPIKVPVPPIPAEPPPANVQL